MSIPLQEPVPAPPLPLPNRAPDEPQPVAIPRGDPRPGFPQAPLQSDGP